MFRMKTLISGFLLLVLLSPGISAAGDLAVIVHKDNPLSTISSSDLSKIYKGRMTSWPSGGLIVVVNRDLRSDAQATFYDKVLGSNATQKFFLPGSPVPFRTIVQKSNEGMVEFVASEVKAIGYVDMAGLPKGAKGVKVIKVIK